MLRLVTTSRRALVLYGALLVLPTLVLGTLYWSELHRDFAREREDIPQRAEQAAGRIIQGMNDRLLVLLEGESQRSFTQYAEVISPEGAVGDDLTLQHTPLEKDPMPVGVIGWFSFRTGRKDTRASPIQVFIGTGVTDRERWRAHVDQTVASFRRKDFDKAILERFDVGVDRSVPLCSLAISQAEPEERECVRRCMDSIRERTLTVNVSDYRLHFFRDAERRPLAIASRSIKGRYEPRDLPSDAPCLASLAAGVSLKQGFVIDLQWLLKDLPWDIAKTALNENEELRAPPEGQPLDSSSITQLFADFRPLEELGFEVEHPEDLNFGRLEIVIDTERVEERIARQSQSFLMTGGMLLLTLGIGMTLLYTSVRRELAQAQRMQDFVAAVTHELRTPISTIRLHGEMLQDGWVAPEKQPEYYDRIVRETQRLSTLVERVLEKSRLKENVTRPVAGDLNTLIEAQREDLLAAAGDRPDVAFQLEPGLPKVWLTQEGVSMIVSNLVENARKYAPAGQEPLLVRTRWSDGRVLLEVLDRGPGVPEGEREKIFEAFYRIGREETRRTIGTGLGLHLVRLHAETCGARASVEPREGGGSNFRVAFRPAE